MLIYVCVAFGFPVAGTDLFHWSGPAGSTKTPVKTWAQQHKASCCRMLNSCCPVPMMSGQGDIFTRQKS